MEATVRGKDAEVRLAIVALLSGGHLLVEDLPGTGKTHLAAGIGLRLMKRDNRRVLFTTVMRAVRSIKETWTRGSELTESESIEKLVAPDLLILDEVGVQFGSETEKLMLFDVLNERYERRRPTLLISNLDLDGVLPFAQRTQYLPIGPLAVFMRQLAIVVPTIRLDGVVGVAQPGAHATDDVQRVAHLGG